MPSLYGGSLEITLTVPLKYCSMYFIEGEGVIMENIVVSLIFELIFIYLLGILFFKFIYILDFFCTMDLFVQFRKNFDF